MLSSTLVQSGGFFPELNIPLSPIAGPVTSAVPLSLQVEDPILSGIILEGSQFNHAPPPSSLTFLDFISLSLSPTLLSL